MEAQLLGYPGCVQRPSASERYENVVTGVPAALGRDELDCAHDAGVGHPHGAVGDLTEAHVEASRECGERALRRCFVDLHPAAQEGLRLDRATNEVRVRDGGVVTAAAVAGGSGVRARRTRPDP